MLRNAWGYIDREAIVLSRDEFEQGRFGLAEQRELPSYDRAWHAANGFAAASARSDDQEGQVFHYVLFDHSAGVISEKQWYSTPSWSLQREHPAIPGPSRATWPWRSRGTPGTVSPVVMLSWSSSRFTKIAVAGAVLLLVALGLTYRQYASDEFFANVYVRLPDGEVRRISPDASGKYYEANVHPSGRMAVFFGNAAGPPQIWLTRFDHFEPVALTSSEYASRHPAFAPTGDEIVFVSDMNSGSPPDLVENMGIDGAPSKGINTHIYVMKMDGSSVRQITFGSHQDQRPTVSPDGRSIAFVSDRGGEYGVWSTSATPLAGADPVPLVADEFAYRPNYSPDGEWLYFFTAKGEGRHQICRLKLASKQRECLRNDDRGYSHGPFPSPAGDYVLMHSTRGGHWALWKVPLDGSQPSSIQPAPFRNALHPTEARDGTLTFDVLSRPEPVETLLSWKHAWLGD